MCGHGSATEGVALQALDLACQALDETNQAAASAHSPAPLVQFGTLVSVGCADYVISQILKNHKLCYGC